MSIVLGIDGGGTGTTALCLGSAGEQLALLQEGPSNIRLATDEKLLRLLRKIRRASPKPDAICAGFAGLRSQTDQKRLASVLSKVWPRTLFRVTHDLQIALAAASSKASARILILSGTGSCCYGEGAGGAQAKAGGWGHLLGDRGSGYDLSVRFLRQLIAQFDLTGRWPAAGAEALRRLALNSPEDLIDWVQSADKAAIADLAPLVFASKSPSAREIISSAAADLAAQAARCARVLNARDAAYIFAGSVFLHQPGYQRKVAELLRAREPASTFEVLAQPPAFGACKLAAKLLRSDTSPALRETEPEGKAYSPVGSTQPPPTELRNPRSMNFSELTAREAAELMLREEASVPRALLRSLDEIEAAIELIVRAFKKNGRLFYVGAGTSGRLGALDASECPPTFRTAPQMVQAIIAGGQRAFWRAVEGAEDNLQGGREAIEYRQVTRRDLVVGIAASGRTPFVWGAIEAAKRRGARTILVTFNPWLEIPARLRPDVVIAPTTGPEVLTGSTRLKAGTATKIVLNMLTTVAMARLGKIMGNLMVDLNPSNLKLRDRAVRIVCELTSAKPEEARSVLESCGWVVKKALKRLRD